MIYGSAENFIGRIVFFFIELMCVQVNKLKFALSREVHICKNNIRKLDFYLFAIKMHTKLSFIYLNRLWDIIILNVNVFIFSHKNGFFGLQKKKE